MTAYQATRTSSLFNETKKYIVGLSQGSLKEAIFGETYKNFDTGNAFYHHQLMSQGVKPVRSTSLYSNPTIEFETPITSIFVTRRFNLPSISKVKATR